MMTTCDVIMAEVMRLELSGVAPTMEVFVWKAPGQKFNRNTYGLM